VTEVFAAREKATGFSSAQVIPTVKNIPAVFTPTQDIAVSHLESNLLPGDVVLVLSAGDATLINQKLLQSTILQPSLNTTPVK